MSIDTRSGGLGNKRASRDHANNRIVMIRQNTEKSPGDLRKLAVSHSERPLARIGVKKTLKGVKG